MVGQSESGGEQHEPCNPWPSVPNMWPRNRLCMGQRRSQQMKTYTDGYRDALLDIKNEMTDSPMTIKDVDILLDELLQDLASL